MKKILTLFTALFFITQIFGAVTTTTSTLKAEEIVIPVGNTGKSINLQELSTISLKDFQQLTGRKLRFSDKVAFKLAQRKLRSNINEDGVISNKNFERAYKSGFFGAHDFSLSGFALGFFLSLVGVLIAYLINDDVKPDRTYWAWRGFFAGLAIALAILGAAGI